MHSTFKKVTKTVASSRLAESLSSSVSWRDEIDNIREAERWDDALEYYRRLGKDKDHAVEVLILGQKQFSEGASDDARKNWQSLVDNNKPEEISYLVGFMLAYFL